METISHSPSLLSKIRLEATIRSPSQVSPASFDNILPFSGTKRRRTNDSITPSEQYRTVQLPPISQELQHHFPVRASPSNSSCHTSSYYNSYASPTEANETRRIEAEYAKLADTEAAKIPDEPLLSFSSWKKNFRWPNQYTTQQCVCLFRYYVDVLGPWVSADTINGPQRADNSSLMLEILLSNLPQSFHKEHENAHRCSTPSSPQQPSTFAMSLSESHPAE